MWSQRMEVTSREECNSRVAFVDGICTPRPPSHAGKANSVQDLASHQRGTPWCCCFHFCQHRGECDIQRQTLSWHSHRLLEYVAGQVESKVNEWTSNIQGLATIAATQPHAAYSALTHGLMSKWKYLSRTIPDISPLLRPLDDALLSVLWLDFWFHLSCHVFPEASAHKQSTNV